MTPRYRYIMGGQRIGSGDRVYRYVWAGGETSDLQYLTVVRVNRVSVTVRTDAGAVIRIAPEDIAGFVTWAEDE